MQRGCKFGFTYIKWKIVYFDCNCYKNAMTYLLDPLSFNVRSAIFKRRYAEIAAKNSKYDIPLRYWKKKKIVGALYFVA